MSGAEISLRPSGASPPRAIIWKNLIMSRGVERSPPPASGWTPTSMYGGASLLRTIFVGIGGFLSDNL